MIPIQTNNINEEELHRITAEVKYDYSYETVRENASAHIYQQLMDAQNYFLSQFGIVLDVDFDIDKILSVADANCPGRNADGTWNMGNCIDCENKPNINNEHGNVGNLANSLSKSSQIAILFTSHDLCWDGKDGHYTNIGGVCSHETGIIDARIVIGYQELRERELARIVHEVGHALGAIDHYGDVGLENTAYFNGEVEMKEEDLAYFHGNNVYNSDCIYGENHHDYNIRKNIVLCNGCRINIQNKLNEIY